LGWFAALATIGRWKGNSPGEEKGGHVQILRKKKRLPTKGRRKGREGLPPFSQLWNSVEGGKKGRKSHYHQAKWGEGGGGAEASCACEGKRKSCIYLTAKTGERKELVLTSS